MQEEKSPFLPNQITKFGIHLPRMEVELPKIVSLINDNWCRYECQQQASTHMHGFLWLPNAPMDMINRNNQYKLDQTKKIIFP